MTKIQKIIVLVAAVLIVAAVLFPPYWDYVIDNQGHITNVTTKWEFSRDLEGIIKDVSSGNWMFAVYEFPLRRGLWALEIFAILLLAGAALLITGKKGSEGKGITKTKRIIILAAAILFIIILLFPPYLRVCDSSDQNFPTASGWTFMFELIKVQAPGCVMKIRFDLLGIEIFGILVLASGAYLIAKKKRPGGE